MKFVHLMSNHFRTEIGGILKREKIENKSKIEVAEIWNSFHGALPESVSMVMNQKKMNLLLDRLRVNPMFMQPLLRDLRYLLLMSYPSASGKVITFHEVEKNEINTLEKDPEFVVRIFPELLATHQISLVRGDIIEKAISKSEAEIIMRGLIGYYTDDELYNSYVIPFNQTYKTFDHKEFIDDYFSRFHRKDYEDKNF